MATTDAGFQTFQTVNSGNALDVFVQPARKPSTKKKLDDPDAGNLEESKQIP